LNLLLLMLLLVLRLVLLRLRRVLRMLYHWCSRSRSRHHLLQGLLLLWW
jgi:hypothetical protein